MQSYECLPPVYLTLLAEIVCSGCEAQECGVPGAEAARSSLTWDSTQPPHLPHRKRVQSQNNKIDSHLTMIVLPNIVVLPFDSFTQCLRTSVDDTAALGSLQTRRQECTISWYALLITTTTRTTKPVKLRLHNFSRRDFEDIRSPDGAGYVDVTYQVGLSYRKYTANDLGAPEDVPLGGCTRRSGWISQDIR